MSCAAVPSAGAFEDRGYSPPTSIERLGLPEEDEVVVGQLETRFELENELLHVEATGELAVILSDADQLRQPFLPFPLHRYDQVVDAARARIHLRQEGGEEASAREDLALDVGEVGLAQGLEPRESLGGLEGRPHDLLLEDRSRGLDGRQLELLLRAEMGVQTALADAERFGESPDGQPVDPLHRGDPSGDLQDCGVGPFAVPAPPAPVTRLTRGSCHLDKIARPFVLSKLVRTIALVSGSPRSSRLSATAGPEGKAAMPRALFATILALAATAACSASGARNTPDSADVAGDLTVQERIWTEAIKNRDRQVLDRLLADDFIFTDDEGNVYDKEQYISAIVDLIRVASYTVDQTAVHVYGDTGIVAGRWTGTQTIEGKDASGAFRFTDTFVRRPGGWQGVASHDTRIPAGPAQ